MSSEVHKIFPTCCLQALALPTLLGILMGYLTYDCLHYAMHQGVGRRWPLLKQARPDRSCC